jgi:hypothetical protein
MLSAGRAISEALSCAVGGYLRPIDSKTQLARLGSVTGE